MLNFQNKWLYEGFAHMPLSQFKGQGRAKAFPWFRDQMNTQILRLFSSILLLCSISHYLFVNASSTFVLAFSVNILKFQKNCGKYAHVLYFFLFI